MKPNRIYFRALTEQDLPTLMTWRNNPRIADNILGPIRFISLAHERQWLEKTLNDKTAVRCAICTKKDNRYIGNIYATDIDNINRTAEMHIFIGDDKSIGRGYAAESIKIMTDYLFNEINLERLEARIFENNSRSIKLFESCGFEREGTHIGAVYKHGQRKTVLSFALLRSKWGK
jgi:RimJ/RimL family protein N-acetyltransferase